MAKESREVNSRFKPTGKCLKQATLLFVMENKLMRRESTVYNYTASEKLWFKGERRRGRRQGEEEVQVAAVLPTNS